MNTKTLYDDGTYLRNNPSWHEEDSSFKAEKIKNLLQKNTIDASSICEIGCGAGEIINILSDFYGSSVTFLGYEISPQAFEICRNKEKSNLHFVLGDLLKEEKAFFDVVMAIDVFEHVEDYLGFVRNLRTKGRYKVFHIPLDLSVQTVFRGDVLSTQRKKLGHLHYFTKETALATLTGVGYEIVDYTYTAYSLELPNRSWRSRLLEVPRKLLFSIHHDLTVRIFGGFSLLVLAK
jgi:cyclopropane fatty-acyl-phospholipid synthase-like methyltransferase